MSIRITCRNGHSLKVKDSWAGKVGLCPVCRVQIVVPSQDSSVLNEDDILQIMGVNKNTSLSGETMVGNSNSFSETPAPQSRSKLGPNSASAIDPSQSAAASALSAVSLLKSSITPPTGGSGTMKGVAGAAAAAQQAATGSQSGVFKKPWNMGNTKPASDQSADGGSSIHSYRKHCQYCKRDVLTMTNVCPQCQRKIVPNPMG